MEKKDRKARTPHVDVFLHPLGDGWLWQMNFGKIYYLGLGCHESKEAAFEKAKELFGGDLEKVEINVDGLRQ